MMAKKSTKSTTPMLGTKTTSFKKKTIENLGYYVYALMDPDGTIFYIGKGKGNRIFAHVKEYLKKDNLSNVDALNKKLQHIKDIYDKGKKVKHYIIRHGLTNEHALIIESVLIDLFRQQKKLKLNNIESLDNQINGFQSQGVHTIDEIHSMYENPEANILPNEKILAINISLESSDIKKIYNRVKGTWVLNPSRADKADYIVACHNGFIIGVFKRNKSKGWYASKDQGRYCFDGKRVTDVTVLERLLNRSLNRTQGSQNPIWYVNNWK